MSGSTGRRASGVTILANPGCPHCVQAVDHVTDWCVEEGIPVAGIDLAQHPEAAGRLAVEHSPTLVVSAHRELVHVGMPTHDEFLRLLRG